MQCVSEDQPTHSPPQAREPAFIADHAVGRRVLTAALALLVAGAGTGLAIRAFQVEEGTGAGAVKPAGLIAFVDGAKGEVLTVRPDGSALTRLPLQVPGGVGQVAWSPDGRRLALEVQDQPTVAGRFDLFVVNADGTELRRLTEDGTSRSPAWSPDGSRIAYVRQEGGASHVFVMRANGTERSRVTFGDVFDVTPSWSPDGSRIVFARATGGQSDIYTVKTDGTEEARLTEDPGWEGDPEWSPDGETIAFVSERPEPGIYLVAANGTSRTLLVSEESPGKAQNTHLSWSPDGRFLAFSSPRGPGWERAIYLLHVGSEQVTQITWRADSWWGPAWRPNSGVETALTSEEGPAQAGSVDPRVTATIPLGEELATEVGVGDGAAWVGVTEGRMNSGAVLRIDPATNEITARVPLSHQPWYLDVGGGAVWVAGGSEPVVHRIDPETNEVSASIPVPGDGIGAIAAGQDAVWVEVYEDRSDLGEQNPTSLVRIDPATNEVVATIHLGLLAGGYDDEIALGQGGVWLIGVKLTGPSEERGGSLVRIDPETNRIAAIIPIGGFSVGAGPSGVWVTFPEDGVVGRRARDRWLAQLIDPATNEVSGPPVPIDLGILAVTDEGVWFDGYDERERVQVVLLDPATLRVVASAPPVQSYYSGSVLDEESRTVWLATVDSITRIDY